MADTNEIKKLYLQADTGIDISPSEQDGLKLSLNKDSCTGLLFGGNNPWLISYGYGEPNGATPGKIYIQI